MAENNAQQASQPSRTAAAWHSLASSKTLWLAFVMTIIGGGAWVYAAMTRPEPAPQKTSNSAMPSAGFAESSGQEKAPSEPAAPRFIDRVSPTMMRLGVSFMAGFLLAWGIKRFLKWTLLLAVALAAGIYFLRKAGLFDVNYDDLQTHLDKGVDWARSQSGEAKALLKRYVPSGAAAIAGMFFGIRH